MAYIDVFIPFIIGLLMLFNGQSFIKVTDPQYYKKVNLLKKCGLGLLVVAGIYLVAKIYS